MRHRQSQEYAQLKTRTLLCFQHGTASSEGAGGDFVGCEAQAKAEEAHCTTQVGGDVRWFDALGSARCKKDPSQWSLGRGIIWSKMEDTPDDGESWAAVGIPAAAKFDDLIWDTILLGGEGEWGGASHEDFAIGGSVEVDAGGSNEELDITQGGAEVKLAELYTK